MMEPAATAIACPSLGMEFDCLLLDSFNIDNETQRREQAGLVAQILRATRERPDTSKSLPRYFDEYDDVVAYLASHAPVELPFLFFGTPQGISPLNCGGARVDDVGLGEYLVTERGKGCRTRQGNQPLHSYRKEKCRNHACFTIQRQYLARAQLPGTHGQPWQVSGHKYSCGQLLFHKVTKDRGTLFYDPKEVAAFQIRKWQGDWPSAGTAVLTQTPQVPVPEPNSRLWQRGDFEALLQLSSSDEGSPPANPDVGLEDPTLVFLQQPPPDAAALQQAIQDAHQQPPPDAAALQQAIQDAHRYHDPNIFREVLRAMGRQQVMSLVDRKLKVNVLQLLAIHPAHVRNWEARYEPPQAGSREMDDRVAGAMVQLLAEYVGDQDFQALLQQQALPCKDTPITTAAACGSLEALKEMLRRATLPSLVKPTHHYWMPYHSAVRVGRRDAASAVVCRFLELLGSDNVDLALYHLDNRHYNPHAHILDEVCAELGTNFVQREVKDGPFQQHRLFMHEQLLDFAEQQQ